MKPEVFCSFLSTEKEKNVAFRLETKYYVRILIIIIIISEIHSIVTIHLNYHLKLQFLCFCFFCVCFCPFLLALLSISLHNFFLHAKFEVTCVVFFIIFLKFKLEEITRKNLPFSLQHQFLLDLLIMDCIKVK